MYAEIDNTRELRDWVIKTLSAAQTVTESKDKHGTYDSEHAFQQLKAIVSMIELPTSRVIVYLSMALGAFGIALQMMLVAHVMRTVRES